MFWFFALEDISDSFPEPLTTTVPTAAERGGDFSQLLTQGTKYQIYDPATGVISGSRISRLPFANNVIPASKHITLAWGRDYDDVSPIKGVILGGGWHSISVAVDVRSVPENPGPVPAETFDSIS